MSEKELDSSVNEYEEQYKSTNYIKQLPEYIKRYESTYAFYVIVIVMGGTDIEQFYKTKKKIIQIVTFLRLMVE